MDLDYYNNQCWECKQFFDTKNKRQFTCEECHKKLIVEIWVEGYQATGQQGTANCFGWYRANSLLEACEKLAKVNPEFDRLFVRHFMTYWGCKIFDNEEEARKAYG